MVFFPSPEQPERMRTRTLDRIRCFSAGQDIYGMGITKPSRFGAATCPSKSFFVKLT